MIPVRSQWGRYNLPRNMVRIGFDPSPFGYASPWLSILDDAYRNWNIWYIQFYIVLSLWIGYIKIGHGFRSWFINLMKIYIYIIQYNNIYILYYVYSNHKKIIYRYTINPTFSGSPAPQPKSNCGISWSFYASFAGTIPPRSYIAKWCSQTWCERWFRFTQWIL